MSPLPSRDISDKTERGTVLNHAWRRYGTVNSLALVGLVGGWVAARGESVPPTQLWASPRRRSLVLAKDLAVGASLVAVNALLSRDVSRSWVRR